MCLYSQITNPEYQTICIWSISTVPRLRKTFSTRYLGNIQIIYYMSESTLPDGLFRTNRTAILYAQLELCMENQASNAEKSENEIGVFGRIALRVTQLPVK